MLTLEEKKFIADYFYKRVGKAIPYTDLENDGKFRRFWDTGRSGGPLYICVYRSKKFIGGDHRRKAGTSFSYEGGKEIALTPEEERELERQRKEDNKRREEEQRQRKEALQNADKWIKTLPLLDDVKLPSPHPYLVKKGLVRSYIGRYDKEKNWIIVSLQGPEGEFRGYQHIDGFGNKTFMTGTMMKGAFARLHSPDRCLSLDTILVAEGLATAISIFEATEGRYIVVVAMNCGNLAEAIRSAAAYFISIWKLKDKPEELYKRFLIIADNDKSGAGEEGAREASKETGCQFAVIPNLGDERITDANDYAVYAGRDKLADLLKETLKKENKR